ncbi:MAG: patatin-like phospholipase family protein [Clostridia bacterium]|nr:patatin-like phospholipase family protein [Clostridia bacterium]
MRFFSFLTRLKKPKKVKLGLALGSGGAKGFAELGALKAFEENDIEFSCVSGTSIGSIIGAFYANGYSSTDMVEIIKRLDFGEILSAFMLNMDTSGLYRVIERNLGELNIEDLKKPFMTVATNVETGEAKVFSSGNVSRAVCASSSMPPYFKPVVIDGKRYVDGAFCNSIPADLVKSMGADYIVGVDLSNYETKTSVIERFIPTFNLKSENPKEAGYKYSDIVLKPNLSAFKATSFREGDKMFEIGYREAIENIPKIKNDLERIKKGK